MLKAFGTIEKVTLLMNLRWKMHSVLYLDPGHEIKFFDMGKSVVNLGVWGGDVASAFLRASGDRMYGVQSMN